MTCLSSLNLPWQRSYSRPYNVIELVRMLFRKEMRYLFRSCNEETEHHSVEEFLYLTEASKDCEGATALQVVLHRVA